MTRFTSFVAVEELIITEGGQPRRIEVPVELPEGVSYEGVFGRDDQVSHGYRMRAMKPMAKMSQSFLGGMVTADASASPMFERLEERVFMKRPNEPQSKLDSTLLRIAKKKEKRETFSAEESAKIQNGKVMVQVWLTDTHPRICTNYRSRIQTYHKTQIGPACYRLYLHRAIESAGKVIYCSVCEAATCFCIGVRPFFSGGSGST